MFLEFCLEKAPGLITPAHYISGIFNEVTHFSEVIFWRNQVTQTFYWAKGKCKKMWWTECTIPIIRISVYKGSSFFLTNMYLLWTVVYYNRQEILPLPGWSWSAQIEYKGPLLCFFLGMWLWQRVGCDSWVHGQCRKINAKSSFLWTQYHLLQPLQLYIATAPSLHRSWQNAQVGS